MARTRMETQRPTDVPSVRTQDVIVHREYGNGEYNENSVTGESYETEGKSLFTSFIRSLWGGWGNNTVLQPPVDQNSPSTRSGATIVRSSGADAAKRTAKQYHDPEEGYKCPLCWDKKTDLSCLCCGHVFCTSYVSFSASVLRSTF